jgi:hypothetical protein
MLCSSNKSVSCDLQNVISVVLECNDQSSQAQCQLLAHYRVPLIEEHPCVFRACFVYRHRILSNSSRHSSFGPLLTADPFRYDLGAAHSCS